MSKTKGKPNAQANALPFTPKPGERAADTWARNALRPSIGAAVTAKAYGAKYGDGLELGALVTALSDQAKAVEQGDLKRAEGMLMVQAHTLDAIFNELAQRAAMNMGTHLGATETYLRLALKAQSQCRTTLETLAAIKNPPNVAFVRQANIAAGPQQVNNGVPANYPRARETETQQTELLGTGNELPMDTGTAALKSRGDPQMETVETIDRAENAGR